MQTGNNGLQLFDFNNTPIRTLTNENGEIFFVASDVCRCLDIRNVADAVSRLDDDEKNTIVLNDSNKGNPNKTIINESGLYTLVLGSRKAEAQAFKKWVTSEVLPAIRKTGGYGAKTLTFERVLEDLLFLTIEQNNRILALEQKVKVEHSKMLGVSSYRIDLQTLTADIFEYSSSEVFCGKWYDKKVLMCEFLEIFKIYAHCLQQRTFTSILREYANTQSWLCSERPSNGKMLIKFVSL